MHLVMVIAVPIMCTHACHSCYSNNNSYIIMNIGSTGICKLVSKQIHYLIIFSRSFRKIIIRIWIPLKSPRIVMVQPIVLTKSAETHDTLSWCRSVNITNSYNHNLNHTLWYSVQIMLYLSKFRLMLKAHKVELKSARE